MTIPSVSELTYFIEVGATLNLSKAARRLGISQPSLTLAIQRLEKSLDTPVLIRSKTGVSLTQAGKQLLLQSRKLVQEWEAVRVRALASNLEVQGKYSIGCHPSVGIYSLFDVLPDLLELYPHLEFQIVHDLSRRVLESIIRLETDIGIVVNPVRHPDLIIRKLCDDEVTFWVGEGKRKIQDFRSGEAVLFCDAELYQAQLLLRKLKKGGVQYRRLVTSSNLEFITKMVASGCGIGIIPQRVVQSSSGVHLEKVPEAPVFHDEICLVYRMENKNIRSIQTISNQIIKKFSERTDLKVQPSKNR